MPIRFRKRIKLFPGVYINLSRSGVSTSIGIRGASVTLGHGKTRTNLGIPGTGISHNTVSSNKKQNKSSFQNPAARSKFFERSLLEVSFYAIVIFILLHVLYVLLGAFGII